MWPIEFAGSPLASAGWGSVAAVGRAVARTLRARWLWDDGPQRQVDLVRTLDSDAPTMARSIHRLERAGFVRRTPNASDKRSMIIEATPASMSLRRAVERIWSELEALTVDAMTDDEQTAALRVLHSLENNLQAAERARPAGD